MVTMVVNPTLLDHEAWHAWLDRESPGWIWTVPHQAGMASTARKGGTKDLSILVWLIKSFSSINSYFQTTSLLRVHYKLRDRETAMRAKLTFGNMKVWRS